MSFQIVEHVAILEAWHNDRRVLTVHILDNAKKRHDVFMCVVLPLVGIPQQCLGSVYFS